jgi:dynein heavy chain
VQKKLLAIQIEQLEKIFKPGLSPLNWNSLGINDFIIECSKGVAQFMSVRDQVEKSEERIQAVIHDIETAQLVKDFDWKRSEVMDVQEFYEFFEKHRARVVEDLIKKYEWIGPLLIKIEETTVGTKSGCAPSMAEYYHCWERKVFNAITIVLINGMATFQTLFNTDPNNPRPPLLKIKADFNPPDVVVSALQSVFKLISKVLENILHSARSFTRWMHGTCRLVPEAKESTEETSMFTFYTEIAQNQSLIDMTMSIQNSIQKVFSVMNKYLRSWRKYDTAWGLWDPKRKAELDKIADKNPSVVYFDAYITLYKNLAEGLLNYNTEKDIGFVRIDSIAVISGIRARALEWVDDYGEVLRFLAKKEVKAIQDEIKSYHVKFGEIPTSLEKLKELLNAISEVKQKSMDAELKILDIQERYRTVALYNIKCSDEEHAVTDGLMQEWKDLKDKALTIDRRTVTVKKHFAEVTSENVVEFAEKIRKWYEDEEDGYLEKGPGSRSVDLEDGADAMRQYETELQKYQKERIELVQAQTLFGLPVTSVPQISMVDEDLKKLMAIYEIYMAHASFVNEWSAVLWNKLEVEALQKGAEGFQKRVKKLGKEREELVPLPPFKKLQELIDSFVASIPLIQSLKHDAIRPIHWADLMEIAGMDDMELDMKKFNVGQVFAMELSRFPEEVSEVVVSAQNELKIENELNKIDGIWRNMDLEMGAYKGDRGFVLKPNEEMKLQLEDHILTLQSMASSKYAVKLLDIVKKWEKNLNAVTEIFDCWLLVQRKWMYLESIFIDSDDIRLQLPEEAKKFDKIHKAFKTIMEKTNAAPNVITACCAEGRLEELKGFVTDLDKTQKSLTDYLDSKRGIFPRFYFISDDELLSILGSSDVMSIQPHMLKLFDNCREMTFGGAKKVNGMTSDESEHFDFNKTVLAQGAVENWMNDVDFEMQDSLLRLMKKGVFDYASQERVPWLAKQIGMVGLASSQVWWTYSVEDTFRKVAEGDKNAMKTELAKESQDLLDLINFVREDITPQTRKTVNMMIILDVHARDIVDRFVRDSILDAREFAWESVLRFYWDKKIDDILVLQCTGSMRYMYEYQGLNGRLVITPLTDRCVMTLTTALTFQMGGAPAGPAGTGKT